jgi:hypothetical protein
MGSLIPEAELQAARERYLREHPVPPSRAEILCEVAREDPSLTVAELASAADRSPAWVRRILKQAGIVLNKPVGQRRSRGNQSAKCADCIQQGTRTREAAVLRSTRRGSPRGGDDPARPIPAADSLAFNCPILQRR